MDKESSSDSGEVDKDKEGEMQKRLKKERETLEIAEKA